MSATKRSLLKRGALLATIPALALPLVAASAPGGPASATFGNLFEDQYFQRISTFPVFENNGEANFGEETVAEIIDYWDQGGELIYTDAALEQIGFVDISDPADPQPAGTVAVDGEPTSVSVAKRTWFGARRDYALVGVNTSEADDDAGLSQFENPSGHIAVVDLATKAVVEKIDVGGQPDSVKVSPTGHFAAVVIENERDEDLGDGGIPQLPAGSLEVVRLRGTPDRWRVNTVDLTGLDVFTPEDPEPEFVDIDRRDRAVVSLQENNGIAVVNLRTRRVIEDFSAGTVTLDGVDATEDRLIDFTETLTDVPREPDAVAWVGGLIGTANEGDLVGGSRGWSLFRRNGREVFDTGTSFDERARNIGHYPDDRSENKGSEPEAIAFDYYGWKGLTFVGSERGSFVDVYTGAQWGKPELLQTLPAGLGPEGLLTIPGRDLFVVSSEVDEPGFGVRATVTIYGYGFDAPAYPQVESDGIGWSAMSGMAAKDDGSRQALAVWDSFYAESKVFTVDLAQVPANVVDEATVTGLDGQPASYDLEGIALRKGGGTLQGYWAVNEGAVPNNLPGVTNNLLLKLDENFEVLEEIRLPEEYTACRDAVIKAVPVDFNDPGLRFDTGSPAYAFARELRFGFEGVTELPDGRVFVAQQRGWDFGDFEPELESGEEFDCSTLRATPGTTLVWQYSPGTGTWTPYEYELDPTPANASWVGLSEVDWVAGPGDGRLVFIERDNRTGVFAEVKTLTQVDLDPIGSPPALGDGVITTGEQAVYDLLPDLNATNGWISDKPEGTAIFPDGETFVITDNDGVDDWSGETQLLRLGNVSGLF